MPTILFMLIICVVLVATKLNQTSSSVLPGQTGEVNGNEPDAPNVLPIANWVHSLFGFTGTFIDPAQLSFIGFVMNEIGVKIVHPLISDTGHIALT